MNLIAGPPQALGQLFQERAREGCVGVVSAQMREAVQYDGLQIALVREPFQVLERVLENALALGFLLVLDLQMHEGDDGVVRLSGGDFRRRVGQRALEALPGESMGEKGQQLHARSVGVYDTAAMMHKLLAVAVLSLLSSCGATPDTPEPKHPGRELNVGLLVVDGVYNTELTAPMDMFHHTVFHTDPGMRVFLVGPSLEPVTSFEGLRVLPDYTYESAPPIDVLVVPSAEHSMDTDLGDEAMMDFVRSRGRRARWVVSLCDGAFVLAAAGLLDGREATTFPSDRERLAEMFPAVTVRDDVSFVHDGPTITSEGGARSFEPALYLCELIYGRPAAEGIAGGLVIDWDKDDVPHRVVPTPAE